MVTAPAGQPASGLPCVSDLCFKSSTLSRVRAVVTLYVQIPGAQRGRRGRDRTRRPLRLRVRNRVGRRSVKSITVVLDLPRPGLSLLRRATLRPRRRFRPRPLRRRPEHKMIFVQQKGLEIAPDLRQRLVSQPRADTPWPDRTASCVAPRICSPATRKTRRSLHTAPPPPPPPSGQPPADKVPILPAPPGSAPSSPAGTNPPPPLGARVRRHSQRHHQHVVLQQRLERSRELLLVVIAQPLLGEGRRGRELPFQSLPRLERQLFFQLVKASPLHFRPQKQTHAPRHLPKLDLVAILLLNNLNQLLGLQAWRAPRPGQTPQLLSPHPRSLPHHAPAPLPPRVRPPSRWGPGRPVLCPRRPRLPAGVRAFVPRP